MRLSKTDLGDSMVTMTVGELKARFSDALEMIKKGQEIIVSYGKRKDKIAVLVPYSRLYGRPKRNLGLLRGKASFTVREDFQMSDEEVFSL